jgi:hypothetical protein
MIDRHVMYKQKLRTITRGGLSLESKVMSDQHSKRVVREAPPAETQRVGGAALIVVLAMTGMLMFLGFFFFSFISVERNSASFFATADSQMVHGDYFDFALQQVLIGPTDDLVHSSLYGRKWSLIPNMVGSLGPDLRPQRSMQPFTGRGIHVRYQGDNTNPGVPTGNNFAFDYDGQGASADFTNPDFKILNFSPAANGLNRVLGNFVPDFEPDAGYTYPDINSMFLGHFSLVEDPSDPSQGLKKVWIPSFHRPQVCVSKSCRQYLHDWSIPQPSTASSCEQSGPPETV